ncbi:aminotransferase class I/II-fold pyridoxal phosphate-dependent enzyme [Halorubrum sp. JWXQ-INN 858]|uniref:aminotransferase-like domain-containing protein n=1 Tax=Halorubrum sp. JWXQ-INN 858 TaxID=2690782 RepID=UPI00135CB15B|nr:PLP-dependent aminotransferase family protein [Halorubrum sp. JWXQ-INN 858]MWV64805.1 aminotransferase class I/II-fold pyridoxal phosphate-dependent enzyme [Halorubrum sp. JWXQ-INN 858]
MTDRDDASGVEHLFADTVRETMSETGYGAWRSIGGEGAVPLAFGFPYPASFPNAELVSATEGLLDVEADHALQYAGGEYADSLPDVVVEQAADRGIDCTPAEIHLTNGATHAIDTVCQTFLDPDDLVVVEAPTFMGALRLFGNYGVDIEGVGMDADGLDVDALADVLAARERAGETPPKLLYTIPNFQNPTGVTLSRERRERLLELAATYDFMILEDDPYGQLRYDGSEPPPLKALDDDGRVVRVNTFSKTIAPGVRTGWVIADEAIVEQLDRVNAGGENRFTQGVLARYCESNPLDEAIEGLCDGYRTRRDAMLDSLADRMPPGTSWSEPDGGFFVWVEFPEGVDAEAMLPDAVDEGVTYLAGSFFHDDDGGRRNARLSFSHVSPEEIDEGIAALARATRAALATAEAADD